MKNELIKALKKINNEGIMCYNMMIYGLKENDCVVLGELAYQIAKVDKRLLHYILDDELQLIEGDRVASALIEIAKEVRDSKTNNVKIGYYLLDGYPTLE